MSPSNGKSFSTSKLAKMLSKVPAEKMSYAIDEITVKMEDAEITLRNVDVNKYPELINAFILGELQRRKEEDNRRKIEKEKHMARPYNAPITLGTSMGGTQKI